MTDEPIHADPAVLAGVKEEFRTLGHELRDAPEPVRRDAVRIREGAGEFGAALADGVAAFELSWQSAFDATSETSGSIAANVGGFTLDLEALDLDNT
ncbi:MAG: hypothetical protein WBQ50_20555 [Nocardioides sp.]